MTVEQFFLIANIHAVLTLIGVILVFLQFKAKQDYIKLLGLLLLTSLATVLGGVLLRESGLNPNYAPSVYNLIELPLILLIYYKVTKAKKPNISLLIAIFFVSFGLFNLIFIQKDDINSYTLIIKSIIAIIFSLHFFYWLLKELPTMQLHRLPMFWINSAWIILFSGNLFLYIFTSYLVNALNSDLLLYWTLHNILSIIEVLMIIFALWMDLRNIKSPS